MKNQIVLKAFLCLIFMFNFHTLSAKSIALSFDDGLNPERIPQAEQWNRQILVQLKKHQLQSVLFAAGLNVDSKAGLELVADWGKQGHILANHSYSHKNLNSAKTLLSDYLADIKKNHQLLSGLAGWQNWYRFPYLKEGNTTEKKNGVRNWLKTQDYRIGHVSIDASDWYYSQRFLKWQNANPDGNAEKFKEAYIQHLWRCAKYYDELSQKLFKRSVDHVLLLHTNAINAAFLDDVITFFKSKGWNFISPEKAYQDPVYSSKVTNLPAGESLLWSLAKQRNLENLRYPAEDSRYEKEKLDLLGL